jgi:hypothetical protein
MESSRRFKPPWTLVRENSECYVVKDANGVTLAWLYCRDDAQRYSFGVSKLFRQCTEPRDLSVRPSHGCRAK